MSPDVVFIFILFIFIVIFIFIFTSNGGWRLHEEVNAGSALPEHFISCLLGAFEAGLTIEFHKNYLTIDENDYDGDN